MSVFPPECQFYKSESGCKIGTECSFPHWKVEEQPNKGRRRRWQKCSSNSERCTTVGLCIVGLRAAGICHDFTEGHKSLGTKPTSTIHKICAASSKHPRKQRSTAQQNTSQTSSSTQSLRCEIWGQISRGDWKTRAMRPRRMRGDLPRLSISSKKRKTAFCSPTDEWILPATSTIKPEEREFVVDSGASMHIVSRKDLNSADLETVRVSKSPTTVVTASGEVLTREEAPVCVKQVDLFVKVMLLEETPAVLSLGKLCEDHGYTYQRSKTTSHQKWQEN